MTSHSPDHHEEPIHRPDGLPRREQTRQGWAGDSGIIAVLGAVAYHCPEDIAHRIRPREDGTYLITFSEARQDGDVTEPTGRAIELIVTPELPIFDEEPGTPACAQIGEGTAWCPLMEKAFAGVDQTWTADRRAAWEDDWAGLCAQDRARNLQKPRSGPAPTGYSRLHQGATAWDQAEALTQLTGQPAVVREFPSGRDAWKINRILRVQLTDGKPVLVSSRTQAHKREVLPHNFVPAHVYEVTGIEKEKIILRNPWNQDQPEPMETDEFTSSVNCYYSTLI